VTCHAGCTIDAIAAAAGIDVVEFSRLAPTDKYEAEDRKPSAVCAYRTRLAVACVRCPGGCPCTM
jgi:hypothetical protein